MRARNAFEVTFNQITGRKNGEAPDFAEPVRKTSFIINRFRENPRTCREQNNRAITARQFGLIRPIIRTYQADNRWAERAYEALTLCGLRMASRARAAAIFCRP